MLNKHFVAFVVVAITVIVAGPASAEPVTRSSWVPNVGQLEPGEQPLGDLWTFKCPNSGTVTASVDNKDDLDTPGSCLDAVLILTDKGGGVVSSADDNTPCTYTTTCGYDCPLIVAAPCGNGGTFSLIVRDFGTATLTPDFCNKGGGYELTVEGFDAGGDPVEGKKLKLGGGPKSKLPKWARALGKARIGPALDDENVPSDEELFAEEEAGRRRITK